MNDLCNDRETKGNRAQKLLFINIYCQVLYFRYMSWRRQRGHWKVKLRNRGIPLRSWRMSCRSLRMLSCVWRSTCKLWRLSWRESSRARRRQWRTRRSSSSDRWGKKHIPHLVTEAEKLDKALTNWLLLLLIQITSKLYCPKLMSSFIV